MNLPWFERFPRRVTQGVSRLRGIRDNSPSLSLGSFTHSRPDQNFKPPHLWWFFINVSGPLIFYKFWIRAGRERLNTMFACLYLCY